MLNKRYRLLLPSTIHTLTWLITSILMYLEVIGRVGENFTINEYNIIAEYICYMMIAAVIGFNLAHITIQPQRGYNNNYIPLQVINAILKRFHWILYICLIVGFLQVAFLFSIGGFESFEDYRLIAVTVKRNGYAAIAQQLSGHLSIIASFYLSLLGYKQSISGINIKEFIKVAICIASLNLAIGGRSWIISTTLPFITAYFYGTYKHMNIEDRKARKRDNRKIIVLIGGFIIAFSIIGLTRSNDTLNPDNNIKSFFNKFLYYTDGPKMANIVMSQYPPGTFPLEYGKSEFLQKWCSSPMTQKFASSIEDNIALSVTVKSTIPYLYYDWGYLGGIFMWGIYAFILEIICISLIKRNTLFSLLVFVQLAILLFQSPIGPIFTMAVPIFQWLFILYFFRRYLLNGIPNIKQYI